MKKSPWNSLQGDHCLMWAGKSVHGDKMGRWETLRIIWMTRVKMVSLKLKKVSRDLPTVGVRIIKLEKEPPCP